MSLSNSDKVCDLRGVLQNALDGLCMASDEEQRSTLVQLTDVLMNIQKGISCDWEIQKNALATIWATSSSLKEMENFVEILKELPNCVPNIEDNTDCQEFWLLYEMLSVFAYVGVGQKGEAKKCLLKCREMFASTQPGTNLFTTFRIALYFTYYQFYTNRPTKYEEKVAFNGIKYLKYSIESGEFCLGVWINDLIQICGDNCIVNRRFRQSHYLIRAARIIVQNAKTDPNVEQYNLQLDNAFRAHTIGILSVVLSFARSLTENTGEYKLDSIESFLPPRNECLTFDCVEVPDGEECLDRLPYNQDEVEKVYKAAKKQLFGAYPDLEKILHTAKEFFNINV